MRLFKLLTSVSLCFAVAFLGSLITLPSIPTWYAQLNKPFFSPPNWIFGPVWTILYLLMGLSLFLVWDKGLKNKIAEKAVKIFLVQLALNLAWSVVFFGFHLPWLAFAIIIALWIFIFMTIKYFSKISKSAAYLLLPYIVWVSFAAFLNLFITLIN